jgi:hypothetical protein
VSRFLVIAIVGLAVLTAAGPTVVALTHAAVPLVIAAGVVTILVRAVWYFTSRW